MLTGCVSTLKRDIAKFEQQTSCCDSVATLEFVEFDGEETLNFGKKQTLVFKFDEIKSYYGAFVLKPEHTKLHIRSHIMGSWLPKAHITLPRVLFLNSAKIKIQDDLPLFTWGHDFWSGGLLEADIQVPKNAQYMIVYSDNRRVGETISYTNHSTTVTPIMTGGAPVYIANNSTSQFDIPFSPAGEIDLVSKKQK